MENNYKLANAKNQTDYGIFLQKDGTPYYWAVFADGFGTTIISTIFTRSSISQWLTGEQALAVSPTSAMTRDCTLSYGGLQGMIPIAQANWAALPSK